MSAAKFSPNNLIAIVDKNQFQIDGATKDVMPPLDPLADKYEAFGWHVHEVNGHSLEEIMAGLRAVKEAAQKYCRPAVLISHTIRGKGVSFMEGSDHWHAGTITKEQFAHAIKELS
jgi:transketolase